MFWGWIAVIALLAGADIYFELMRSPTFQLSGNSTNQDLPLFCCDLHNSVGSLNLSILWVLDDQRLEKLNMMLIGLDYHPSFQQIAFFVEDSCEYAETTTEPQRWGGRQSHKVNSGLDLSIVVPVRICPNQRCCTTIPLESAPTHAWRQLGRVGLLRVFRFLRMISHSLEATGHACFLPCTLARDSACSPSHACKQNRWVSHASGWNVPL